MKCGLLLKIDGRELSAGDGAYVLDVIPSVKSAQRDRQPSMRLAFCSVVTHDRPTLHTC